MSSSILDLFPVTNGVHTVIPAPDGYVVDFAHPRRDEAAMQRIYWCFGVGMVLSTSFLLQNLYVKLQTDRKFDSQTVCIVLAWALSIFVQSALVSTVVDGLTCTHAWELPLQRYNYWTKMFFVASVVYTPTTGAAKLSLLLFYRKLSPATWWKWSCNLTLFFLGSYSLAITCSMIFTCHPLAKSWDILADPLGGTCLDRPALYMSFASLQIATDLILCVMPIPMISGLLMPTHQKVGLMVMFVIASSTVVTSCMRLKELIPVLSETDQTWAMGNSVMMICIEGPLLIICATFPTIRRFFDLVAPRCFGESYANSRSGVRIPDPPGQELKTFGAGSTRKRLDTLGLTVDEEGGCSKGESLSFAEASEVQIVANHEGDRKGHAACSQPGVQPAWMSEEGGLGDGRSCNSSSVGTLADQDNLTWDSRPADGEREAERGIIQTHTVTVTTEILPTL